LKVVWGPFLPTCNLKALLIFERKSFALAVFDENLMTALDINSRGMADSNKYNE